MSEKAPKVNAEDTTIGGAEQHTVDERAIVQGVDRVDSAQDETAKATLGLGGHESTAPSANVLESLGFAQDGVWSYSEIAAAVGSVAFAAYIVSFLFRSKRIVVGVK